MILNNDILYIDESKKFVIDKIKATIKSALTSPAEAPTWPFIKDTFKAIVIAPPINVFKMIPITIVNFSEIFEDVGVRIGILSYWWAFLAVKIISEYSFYYRMCLLISLKGFIIPNENIILWLKNHDKMTPSIIELQCDSMVRFEAIKYIPNIAAQLTLKLNIIRESLQRGVEPNTCISIYSNSHSRVTTGFESIPIICIIKQQRLAQ